MEGHTDPTKLNTATASNTADKVKGGEAAENDAANASSDNAKKATNEALEKDRLFWANVKYRKALLDKQFNKYEFYTYDPTIGEREDTAYVLKKMVAEQFGKTLEKEYGVIEEYKHAVINELGGLPPTAMGTVKALNKTLKDDIYISANDPRYKFKVDKGTIRPVDIEDFSVIGPSKFSQRECCRQVMALLDLRGDKDVFTIDWPKVDYISEKVMEKWIKEAIKEGKQIKLGTNAENFLNSNLVYEFNSKTSDYKATRITHEEQVARRKKFDKLLEDSLEAKKKEEENLKNIIDDVKGRDFAKYNLEDVDKLKQENNKLTTPDDDYKKIFLKEATPGKEKDIKNIDHAKVEGELKTLNDRLSNVDLIEKRLKEEREFYTTGINTADNKDKVEKIETELFQGENEIKKNNRNKLFDQLSEERADIEKRFKIIQPLIKNVTVPPQLPNTSPSAEQKKHTEVIAKVGDLDAKIQDSQRNSETKGKFNQTVESMINTKKADLQKEQHHNTGPHSTMTIS